VGYQQISKIDHPPKLVISISFRNDFFDTKEIIWVVISDYDICTLARAGITSTYLESGDFHVFSIYLNTAINLKRSHHENNKHKA
jgi:hypothetical protein